MTLWKAGKFNHVPLINGNIADEENFNLAITEFFTSTSNALRTPPTAQQYMDFVNTTYTTPAGAAAKVLALYPLSAFKTPQLAWDRVWTDNAICTQRRFDKIVAPQIPLYTYAFNDPTAPFYFPDMPGLRPISSTCFRSGMAGRRAYSIH